MRAKSLKDEIHLAFSSYITHANSTLDAGRIARKRGDQPLKLAYIDPAERLRVLVARSEDSAEFQRLCSVFAQLLTTGKKTTSPTGRADDLDQLLAHMQLRAFFRRSKFYLRSFAAETQSPAEFFEYFWTAFLERTVTITVFRILDEVEFASPVITFPSFKIRRVTAGELHKLTSNDVNEIFYPSTRLLIKSHTEYWLLMEEYKTKSGLNLGQIPSVRDGNSSDLSEWEWSKIKPDIPSRPIQLLAIHDWIPDFRPEEREQIGLRDEEIRDFWWGFSISKPFVCDDDPFHDPEPFPHSQLPFQLHEQSPGTPNPINNHQEKSIEATVTKGELLLGIVEAVRPHWDFIELAIGYLGKAFLADRSVEQLLWNMTVLDCLLSEKDGVSQSMKRRLGNILGTTQQEKKDIRKNFDELYSFRSDLVHGNKFERSVHYRHLAKARDLARQVLAWFIDYLLWIDDDLQKCEVSYQDYPRRDELLLVLDLEAASLTRLSSFIGRLPGGFPKF